MKVHDEAGSPEADVKRPANLGIKALQGQLEGGSLFRRTCIVPMRSWTRLKQHQMDLECVQFAQASIHELFKPPLREESHGDELEFVWEELQTRLECEGMPQSMYLLSRAIASDLQFQLLSKWSAFEDALRTATRGEEDEPAANAALACFNEKHISKIQQNMKAEDGLDVLHKADWDWAPELEEMIRQSQEVCKRKSEAGDLDGMPSDCIIDRFHCNKRRILFDLVEYRAALLVQIDIARSIQNKMLAFVTSFAIAVWPYVIEHFKAAVGS